MLDATQLNYAVLIGVLLAAAALAGVVGVLSSRSLREEGLRRVVKRWLGR